MIFMGLLILIGIGLVNTLLLVAISSVLLKMVSPTKKDKQKAPKPGLMDLPMRYERQTDYGDTVRSQQVPADLWLVKDE